MALKANLKISAAACDEAARALGTHQGSVGADQGADSARGHLMNQMFQIPANQRFSAKQG